MSSENPQFFDSHCHLEPEVFEGDAGVDAAVARALDAGVARMITIGSGYGAEAWRAAIAVAERHPQVWAALGIHPHDARFYSPERFAELTEALEHPRVVALGEMGLDFHYDSSPREEQRAVFRTQIRAARERGLPIVVHDRASDGETLAILKEERAFDGRGVLYHCFTGTVAEMQDIVAQGGYISIPGIVTFKNAGQMREVARLVPDDRLLIETDSPFLTPVPFRGRRNEPARVALVGQAIAELRGASVSEVARKSWCNTCIFFGIPQA